MGYSALSYQQQINEKEFGIPFPRTPEDLREKRTVKNLERACLDFLRDYCEELRFDPTKVAQIDRDGGSIKKNMIPYNMEMDIDRLCLENAVHRFMISGTAQDAFDIYFCFLEMYLGDYAKAKKMIEMLAEFESNASALLMKHRDHYSHSAYVFILGMAIYARFPAFRADYQKFCGIDSERAAAHHFLRQWGFTALFHDIGYPFELPFEQVKSYFGNTIQGVPYVSYRGLEEYLSLSDKEKKHYETLLGTELPCRKKDETVLLADLTSVLAAHMAKVFPDVPASEALDIISRKPEEPNLYSGYMDHAYFSAVILFRQLRDVLGEEAIGLSELDIILAILLHNSIYKRSLQTTFERAPLRQSEHPLTFLLMLCDELQCWDRISYGKESRSQLHPMWCEFIFDQGKIKACYHYDVRMKERAEKAETAERNYLAEMTARGKIVNEKEKKPFLEGTYPKMTSHNGKWCFFTKEDQKTSFVKDIEEILAINGEGSIGLEISTSFEKNNRVTKTYLSNSSFLHLYNFAVALNSRYEEGDIDALSETEMETAFDCLSLEYKISNIQQAKAFGRYLDAIRCFYTDKPVTYELMDSFSDASMAVIGPMEHDRWLAEKLSMGWSLDDAFKTKGDYSDSERKQLREITRTHNLMINDFKDLDEKEQDKDTKPMDCMLKLIEKYDGLRIYRI